ncbi:hypothetical protein BJ741DRAFT_622841 [Chytriomyces cf. hyalinus JEL632]|nr:hypothetical protein BJ741DRAFT_622841 [Chytriomyces cf. hyalinus JEL632]
MTTRKDHRHRASLDAAVVYIADLYASDALWEYVKTVEDVRISVRSSVPLPNRVQDKSPASAAASLLPTFRGDGAIQNVTVQEVASVLRGFGARKLWDPRFEQGKHLDTLSDTANLVLSSQRGNLLVRSRDFLTANEYKLSNTADEAFIVSTSVVDKLAPPEGFWGNYTRADAKAIGWVVKQNGPDVNMTYIVEVDAKGTIPTSLIKLIQVQAPLCIKHVAETISKNGSLPFIIRGLSPLSHSRRLVITSEWVEPDTNFLKAKIIIPTGKCDFSIAFPTKGKYAHGACIETNIHSLTGTATLTARQVTSREQMQDIVSDAVQCVLQFKIVNFGATVNEVLLTVRPSPPPRLSATRLSVLARLPLFDERPPVFEVDGEPVVEALMSPVDSAVDFGEKQVLETQPPIVEPKPATYVGSIYASRVPMIVDNLLGVMDTCAQTAVQTSASLLVSSYLTATTLMYGTPTSKPNTTEPSSSESVPVPSEQTTLEPPQVSTEQPLMEPLMEPLKDVQPEPPASRVDSAVEFNENQTATTEVDSAVELNENQTTTATATTEPKSLKKRALTQVKSLCKSHTPRFVHRTLDMVDNSLEKATILSVSAVAASYQSATTLVFVAPKPKITTETTSEPKPIVPTTEVKSIYTSYPPRLVHGALDIVDKCMESAILASVSTVAASYQSATTLVFGTPKPTTEVTSEQKAAPTKVQSIYKSHPPRLAHGTLDIIDSCLETATKLSVTVLETSYRSAATMLFGAKKKTPETQPKSPEEQQRDDQLYNLILEQVL